MPSNNLAPCQTLVGTPRPLTDSGELQGGYTAESSEAII